MIYCTSAHIVAEMRILLQAPSHQNTSQHPTLRFIGPLGMEAATKRDYRCSNNALGTSTGRGMDEENSHFSV
jgi:hypothetical protein